MARPEKKVRVRITAGVIFEGKDLFPGETHPLPEWFAQSLIQGNRGVDADEAADEDEAEAEGEAEAAGEQQPQQPQRPSRPRG